MATMKEVYNAKNKFNDVVRCFLRYDDDDPNNSAYTPTLKKALDDVVSAYKRATAEIEYRNAQEEESEARAKLQECENNTKDAKIRFYALNKGVDATNGDALERIDNDDDDGRDPSDGPFLTQEPEEPDGFYDCPECCGE